MTATATATRLTFTPGQTLNRTGDTFHHQWTILAVDSDTITVGQDDGYEETLTATQLTAELTTPAAPTYYLDEHTDLWQSTLDGRYRRWQTDTRTWGPVEDTDWVETYRILTPLA